MPSKALYRPKKIQVEGDEVTISWDVGMGRSDKEGYPWAGDYKKDHIRMAGDSRRSSLKETLFHELLHKVWEKSGLTKTYGQKTEEYIITSLSGWLVDLLRDNPELVDYLTEET